MAKEEKCEKDDEIIKIKIDENISATQENQLQKTDHKNSKPKEENENKRKTKQFIDHNLKNDKDYLQTKDDIWWLIFASITLVGVVSRLHYITMPFAVVWDETHFGKMASWYLNRTFFFDVHPPGGKLLLALFGYLADYNGTYPFKVPGESYEGYDEIMYMRLGCALFGAGMVPLAFLTVWELTTSLLASSFSGLLFCYEIGLITLSKFILLDPLMMYFIMASFHALCVFHRENLVRPWSNKWWLSLSYTGISLGCTMSVKFVGVFIVLIVGLYAATDLWDIFSKITNSLWKFFLHFVTRAMCLILIPLAIYTLIFFIHDQVLIYCHRSEHMIEDLGLGTFSPEFQKRIINSSLYKIKQPAEVSYGSVITLRNDELGGGYLHSHNFTYPETYVKGKLQQVTSLKGKDMNNFFRVLFPMDDPDMADGFYFGEPESVMNDNWIRLHHVFTNATVSCHKNKSIVATKLNLVYATPYNLTLPTQYVEEDTKTFANQYWNVKIENGKVDEPIRTLRTRFQLISPKFNCALTWSKEKLSHIWGFHQGEIACTKNFRDPYSFWKVETVANPHADNSSFDNITISFLNRFIESHQVMTFINARLKATEDSFNLDSPWMWPILYKASPWYDVSYRIVLLGNPFLFLLNLFSLIATPVILIRSHYKHRRSWSQELKPLEPEEKRRGDQFIFAIRWLYIAYMFHYIPFFTMQRILYFHHYFPSHAFACMLTAILLSKFLETFGNVFSEKRRMYVIRGTVFVAMVLLTMSFLLYCYVAYGVPTSGPYALHNSTFKRIRFVDDWLI